MEVKRGTAVSPGVAIGPALVIDTEGIRITHRTVPPEQVPDEIVRSAGALEEPPRSARHARASPPHGPTVGQPTRHESALEDDHPPADRNPHSRPSAEYEPGHPRLRQLPRNRRGNCLRTAGASPGAEFIDIEKQILVRLLGQNSEPLQELTEPVVVLATDLMPSETVDFTPRTVYAFATESGGDTSHTAILADALEIPAVVGLGRFLPRVGRHTVRRR